MVDLRWTSVELENVLSVSLGISVSALLTFHQRLQRLGLSLWQPE